MKSLKLNHGINQKIFFLHNSLAYLFSLQYYLSSTCRYTLESTRSAAPKSNVTPSTPPTRNNYICEVQDRYKPIVQKIYYSRVSCVEPMASECCAYTHSATPPHSLKIIHEVITFHVIAAAKTK